MVAYMVLDDLLCLVCSQMIFSIYKMAHTSTSPFSLLISDEIQINSVLPTSQQQNQLIGITLEIDVYLQEKT